MIRQAETLDGAFQCRPADAEPLADLVVGGAFGVHLSQAFDDMVGQRCDHRRMPKRGNACF
jgi:hypothetical protein